jgi:predicted MPP superfamily phosphohydrolase
MSRSTINIILIMMALVLCGISYVVETIIPQTTLTEISSEPLARVFGGARIVQISDLHIVKLDMRESLALKRLKELQPDLIIITGDLIEPDTDFESLRIYLHTLRRLAPIIVTYGNNDYHHPQRLADLLKELNIVHLRNQAAVIRRGQDSVIVVGLEDNYLWHDDYFAATAGIAPETPKLVLGHAPGLTEKIDPRGIELLLAGHLHGGQINLPIYGPISPNTVCFVDTMYTDGMYHINGIPMFVNRGLGTSYIMLRFLSRPEIAVLKFVP